MSLIFKNKTTLKNNVAIILDVSNNPVKYEQNGDLIIIKSNKKIIGLNILNHDKYFSAEEGAHTLTKEQSDAIEKLGVQVNYKSKFSVGKVIERKQHPKSEKLFLLKVKTNKELQIVTNSLNSLEGTKVVVANVGATLPSGLDIVLSKVMGVESQGMLCGGETLGKEKTNGVLIVENQQEGEAFIL